MSRQAKLALAVLAGAILIGALIVLLRPEPEEVTRDRSAPLVRTMPFETASGAIAVLGSGTVQPREEVTLGAQVSGRLVYVNPQFREGGSVAAGTVLFRIDASDYHNRVRSAQADVAAQSVAVLQAREEARIAKEELERFAAREQAGDLMGQTIDSSDYGSRILPPRDMQGQPGSVARAAVTGSGNPSRLATREPQLRSARAARERAEAQLADARLALGRTEVRAPFSGVIRSESAAVGSLVQPGQELGSMVATGGYEVRVSLTEQEAALIPGLLRSRRSRIPASVEFDYGGRAYRWSAFVGRADAILDPAKRTIDVFLRVPDPLRGGVPVEDGAAAGTAPPLLLGSFVRARITGAIEEAYAQIPAEFLRPGNVVWLVREGKLRILPVRVIQRTDDVAYVTLPSIAAGGRLVTSALQAPVDGMDVRDDAKASSSAAKPEAAAND